MHILKKSSTPLRANALKFWKNKNTNYKNNVSKRLKMTINTKPTKSKGKFKHLKRP